MLNVPDETSNCDSSLERQAAQWFTCIHTREPSTEELAEWQRWLMSDERHREAFERYEKLWGTIKQAEPYLAPRAVNAPTPHAPRSIRAWPVALAASVLIAAVGVTFNVWRSSASTVLAGSSVVETRIAEDHSYTLPDGSRIEVGARSRVVVDFNDSARTVIIPEGEAYFKVAHERRPFVVKAGSGTITAVGTAFNVHNMAGRVSVSVVEGVVDVKELIAYDGPSPAQPTQRRPDPEPSHVVRAGQGVVYGRNVEPVAAVDPRVVTAWRHGTLKFISEPLGYVVADVERYSDFQITIADPLIADLRYTGAVIPDHIEEWLELLPQAFPIDVQRLGKRAVLLKPRSESSPP